MFVSRYLCNSSMETIAHQLLSQELKSDTEQSGEGILRQVDSQRCNSEQSGEGVIRGDNQIGANNT